MFGLPLLSPRLLVELRGIRRALDRLADAQELQVLGAPTSRRSFRGLSREKTPEGQASGSGVSYFDPADSARIAAVEGELRALLGRDPTPEEIERGLLQEVE